MKADNMSIISSLIENQEFATLPPVAAKVLALLENDNIDLRDITRVIEADVSLTMKLLRLANSPLYATKSDVKSVQQAIITLGLNRLTNIVIGVSIFSKFLMSTQKDAAEIMEKFWWHSACTGMVAKALASKMNRFYKEGEFVGGLLHEIGKLAMIQYDSHKFKKVIELTSINNCLDLDAEKEIFETNHLEIGEEIAMLWKLPEELTTIIANHNYPQRVSKYKEIVATVRFADILSEIWGAGIHEGLRAIELEKEESWHVLCNTVPELKDMDMEIFTFDLEGEFNKSSEFLNMIAHE